jgi:hypothetical protein
MLLDQQGNPIPAGSPDDAANRVQGHLKFTAPYLEGGAPLTTAFETSSQSIAKIAFPMPPRQPPGELNLSIFALRGDRTDLKSRVLQPDETLVLVNVWASGRIEIVTTAAESGSSFEGEMLELLAALQ